MEGRFADNLADSIFTGCETERCLCFFEVTPVRNRNLLVLCQRNCRGLKIPGSIGKHDVLILGIVFKGIGEYGLDAFAFAALHLGKF